tara:strand:+ start:961 stop:1200 length:240 start_codon:yes stop_codon:yes gene_type:complete
MKKKKEILFERTNYKFVIIGILFIIIGFLLMLGGGSEDPNIFSEDIYSFTRIRLAPALILVGFGIQVYAILKSPKNKDE